MPTFAEWIKTIKGDHPRMEEMIQAVGKKNSDTFGDAVNKSRI